MTGSFAAGDLVGGIVNGLRQLSDQAGHPAALRHPRTTRLRPHRDRRRPRSVSATGRRLGLASGRGPAVGVRAPGRAARGRSRPGPRRPAAAAAAGWSASASQASAADDGARLDHRREQVLDGVLGDLAGTPVPQRPDLGEVPLHVLGGELPLRRVPEAQQRSPRAPRSARRRRGRPAARSPPSTPRSGAAPARWPPGGPRWRSRPAPPRRRSRRRRPRRWRPARRGTPTARRRPPPGPPASVTRRAGRAGPRRARRCGPRWRSVRDHCSCASLPAGAASSEARAWSASSVQPVGAHDGST